MRSEGEFMYVSTRGNERVSASTAIVEGIARDGGLFVPERLNELDLTALAGASYRDVARKVFALFFDDFTAEEIDEVVDKAYNPENFPSGEVALSTFGNRTFLELWWGPTLAFKDMALTVLPHLVAVAKRKLGLTHRTLVLVATSGDTGGAALSGFKGAEGFDTLVLYPLGGVSQMQEKQMLSFTDDHTHAYALEGNFDDCQTYVKQLFAAYPEGEEAVKLSSANSINIGRLVPQVVYYVYAYLALVQEGKLAMGDSLDVVVPTGNFGDIFAAYLAKRVGTPIGHLTSASNTNNVLYDFFRTGTYDADRPFHKTYSPAMDILVSSNLERLLWYAADGDGKQVAAYMEALRTQKAYTVSPEVMANLKDFDYAYCDNATTLASIREVFDELNYLVDPHTAVACRCYRDGGRHTLIVSTANPYKFPSTIAEALGLPIAEDEMQVAKDVAAYTKTAIPQGIAKLFASDVPRHVTTKDEVKDLVMPHVTVKVPASSANLGPAFDIAGVALSLYDTFVFAHSDADVLAGFAPQDSGEDNLVLRAYRYAQTRLGLRHTPVKIRLLEADIPYSSGLGSSAACIVAGVMAAALLGKADASKRLLTDVMTEMEGHPDNVVPAYLGGLVVNMTVDGEVFSYGLPVSNDLFFTALVPPFSFATKESRKVVPAAFSRADAIHNAARCMLLPEALRTGDIDLIKAVFNDRWHQPYRLPLIEGAHAVKLTLEDAGFAVALSGAGPTLLAVGRRYVTEKDVDVDWKIMPLTIADGAINI